MIFDSLGKKVIYLRTTRQFSPIQVCVINTIFNRQVLSVSIVLYRLILMEFCPYIFGIIYFYVSFVFQYGSFIDSGSEGDIC